MAKAAKALEHFGNISHLSQGIHKPVDTVSTWSMQSTAVSGITDSTQECHGHGGITGNLGDNPVATSSSESTMALSNHEYDTRCIEHDSRTSSPVSDVVGHKRKWHNLLASSPFNKDIMSATSLHYFANEMDEAGAGIRRLVACSFMQANDSSSIASVSETKFHLLLLALLENLNGPQRNKLMTLFQYMHDHPNSFNHTRIPTTISDTNKIYMAGVHSMSYNLPHPKVFTIGNHACVSLRDVIAHQLSHGMEFDNMSCPGNSTQSTGTEVHNTITATKAAHDICAQVRVLPGLPTDTTVLYVTFWSDDFVVSHIKNRRSVWLHTVTVCPPNHEVTSARYTHALAIGLKGVDHEPVLSQFHDELRILNKCNSFVEDARSSLEGLGKDIGRFPKRMLVFEDGCY